MIAPVYQMQEHNLEIGIEQHPTVVPIPIAIVIRDKTTRRILGSLDCEQVRQVLHDWDNAISTYERNG